MKFINNKKAAACKSVKNREKIGNGKTKYVWDHW